MACCIQLLLYPYRNEYTRSEVILGFSRSSLLCAFNTSRDKWGKRPLLQAFLLHHVGLPLSKKQNGTCSEQQVCVAVEQAEFLR